MFSNLFILRVFLLAVVFSLFDASPPPALAHHCGPTQPLPEFPRHSCRTHTQTWQPGEAVDIHPGGAPGRGAAPTQGTGSSQSLHCQLINNKCVCGSPGYTGRNIPCRPEFMQQPQIQQAEPPGCPVEETSGVSPGGSLPYAANQYPGPQQGQPNNSSCWYVEGRVNWAEWVREDRGVDPRTAQPLRPLIRRVGYCEFLIEFPGGQAKVTNFKYYNVDRFFYDAYPDQLQFETISVNVDRPISYQGNLIRSPKGNGNYDISWNHPDAQGGEVIGFKYTNTVPRGLVDDQGRNFGPDNMSPPRGSTGQLKQAHCLGGTTGSVGVVRAKISNQPLRGEFPAGTRLSTLVPGLERQAPSATVRMSWNFGSAPERGRLLRQTQP